MSPRSTSSRCKAATTWEEEISLIRPFPPEPEVHGLVEFVFVHNFTSFQLGVEIWRCFLVILWDTQSFQFPTERNKENPAHKDPFLLCQKKPQKNKKTHTHTKQKKKKKKDNKQTKNPLGAFCSWVENIFVTFLPGNVRAFMFATHLRCVCGFLFVAAPLIEDHPSDDVPLIIILTVSIIGMILLALNVLLILFFIRRNRRRKMEKGQSGRGQRPGSRWRTFRPRGWGAVTFWSHVCVSVVVVVYTVAEVVCQFSIRLRRVKDFLGRTSEECLCVILVVVVGVPYPLHCLPGIPLRCPLVPPRPSILGPHPPPHCHAWHIRSHNLDLIADYAYLCTFLHSISCRVNIVNGRLRNLGWESLWIVLLAPFWRSLSKSECVWADSPFSKTREEYRISLESHFSSGINRNWNPFFTFALLTRCEWECVAGEHSGDV